MSNATRQQFMEFFSKETDKRDEINDKIRLLLINIFCSGDLSDVKQIIDTIKTLHKDNFDEGFIQSLLKKRKDFDNLVG
jgi:hypothetical protein